MCFNVVVEYLQGNLNDNVLKILFFHCAVRMMSIVTTC